MIWEKPFSLIMKMVRASPKTVLVRSCLIGRRAQQGGAGWGSEFEFYRASHKVVASITSMRDK